MTPVPKHIAEAVSGLLTPYGLSFDSIMDSAADGASRYISTDRASELCGLTPKTIREKVLAKEIKGKRLGEWPKGRVLVSVASLREWIERLPDA